MVCAADAIVNEKGAAPLPPLASVAVTVNEAAPPTVGVPEISPAADNVSPVGKAPAVTAKVTAPTPPVAATVWL